MKTHLARARTAGARTAGARTPLTAFTCYTLETALGVVEAAEAAATPTILLVSDATMRQRPAGPRLLAALVAVAAQARVPVFVQLDHCPDLERLRQALDLGAHAVMADGSRLPDAANAAFVREAVAAAAARGAAVEAELGRIEGDEDHDTLAAAAAAGALTDPADAVRFAEDTGVDCLAVAVGNVHGSYRREPRLDWDRLADIVARVPAAVSLHGTSGLPADQVRRARRLGVAKFNVNTELRRRHLHELRAFLATDQATTDVLGLTTRLREGAYATATGIAFAAADTGS